MRDIPLFTTEHGVASLYMKKIPFNKEAYVQIRDSLSCESLIKECVDVCRMAGAEKVFAAGHEALSGYPLHCSVLRYTIQKQQLGSTDTVALTVAPEQKEWWRQTYNEKMAAVATAAPLSIAAADELIQTNKAFCVYRACSLIGIGVAYGGRIHAVASVLSGGGRDTVLALASCLEGPEISLSVASTNEWARKLYLSLGFTETETEAVWYQIF